MPDDGSQAINATVELILADEEGLASMPPDEVISEPKPAEYISPDYLRTTAPKLAPAFAELLALLRDLNSRFAGRRTVEVWAELSLTGDHEWLEEKFLGWCEAYFNIRGNFSRLSPQNGNDPWRLFCDCVKEFDRLFEKRRVLPGTINSSVLNLSRRFILSGFAAQVLGPDLMNYATTGRDRYGDAANRRRAFALMYRYSREIEEFTTFLEQLTPHLAEYAPDDAPEWLTDIQAKVVRCGEDLSFLRNVLCALHVNGAEKRQLSPNLWARLAWDVYHGGSVAAVLTSSSPEPSIERTTMHQLAFRRDGWLCHREFSWMRVQPDYLPDERRVELAVNWYLLDVLTSPLYEAWDRLDPGPVLSRGLEADANEEEQVAAIAVALAQSDTREVPTVVVREKKRVPQLRLSKFEKITADHFGCEWSPGKGSERKVFRPGGKQCTFGCHGTDRPVRPVKIKDCLKKLGIPLADFIAACH